MHTILKALEIYALAAPLVGCIAWALCHGGARVEKRDSRKMQEVAEAEGV